MRNAIMRFTANQNVALLANTKTTQQSAEPTNRPALLRIIHNWHDLDVIDVTG